MNCMRDALDTDEKRNTLLALHSGDHSLGSIVQRNAFNEDYDDGRGQSYRYLLIYRDISRINHSCRPNALVVHPADPTGRTGTLRAIRSISNGEQILVDYLSTERLTLQPIVDRQAEPRDNWGFDCGCEVCGGTEPSKRRDDKDRDNASDYNDGIYDVAQPITQKIANAGKYIKLLLKLQLKDEKLVNAYTMHANLEEESFGTINNPNKAQREHSDAVLAMREKALQTAYICYGPAHKGFQKVEEGMRSTRATIFSARRASF